MCKPDPRPIGKIVIIEESTFPCLNAIPKITWGSFRGQREKMWGSFRGQFGDHFGVGDHFGGCTELLGIPLTETYDLLQIAVTNTQEALHISKKKTQISKTNSYDPL